MLPSPGAGASSPVGWFYSEAQLLFPGAWVRTWPVDRTVGSLQFKPVRSFPNALSLPFLRVVLSMVTDLSQENRHHGDVIISVRATVMASVLRPDCAESSSLCLGQEMGTR